MASAAKRGAAALFLGVLLGFVIGILIASPQPMKPTGMTAILKDGTLWKKRSRQQRKLQPWCALCYL